MVMIMRLCHSKESEKMHIGYIKHKGTKLSKLGEIYIDALKNYENMVL